MKNFTNKHEFIEFPGATWLLYIYPFPNGNHFTLSKFIYCFCAVPPDIIDDQTSGDMVAREGSNVTLSCAATGSPTPNIIWRREDGQKILLENKERGKLIKILIKSISIHRPIYQVPSLYAISVAKSVFKALPWQNRNHFCSHQSSSSYLRITVQSRSYKRRNSVIDWSHYWLVTFDKY